MKLFLSLINFLLSALADNAGALTYDQVTSITRDLIKEKLTEGVFTGSAFLKRVREKQELEEGGNKIICPLFSLDETGTTGAFYGSRDNLTLNEYDGISASEHAWKYVHESVVIYKTDIAANAGKYGVLKLVGSKVKQAEMAMKQRMTESIFNGTSSDEYVGLATAIAASGTYGGIAPADLATWVSYVDASIGTLTLTLADKNFDQAYEEGRGKPTCATMDKNVYTKFKGLLVGYQRTQAESNLDGFGEKDSSIIYNGIPHIVDNQMPAQSIFMIDENHTKLHVHRDHNMRRESHKALETADALLERIFLYSAYVASERKYNSKMGGITV